MPDATPMILEPYDLPSAQRMVLHIWFLPVSHELDSEDVVQERVSDPVRVVRPRAVRPPAQLTVDF